MLLLILDIRLIAPCMLHYEYKLQPEVTMQDRSSSPGALQVT